jgi:hypothetical protein
MVGKLLYRSNSNFNLLSDDVDVLCVVMMCRSVDLDKYFTSQ